MAKESNSAVPETPAKTGGTDDYDTEMLVETPGTDEYTGRSVSFEEDAHESGEAMEEDYDLEEKEDIPEDAILTTGSGTRPLARNLMEELDEVVGPEPAFGDDDEERDDDDEDSKQAVTTSQVTKQKTGYRPPMNGDTPAANKVLGHTYEEMMEKSTWNRLFEPKRIRQAVWADLSHELVVAVTATTTGQVARDTSWIPAEAGADLWKWKRKLRVGFGVTDIHYPQPPIGKTAGGGVEPSKIPLPKTPSKIPLPKTPSKGFNTVPKSHGVFSKSGDETPYFQDSHMITPKSSGRKEQPR
ncbi:Eukaryotic/viral aspartic protease [Phytophthora megakarya]|uniref:Eukaryotic/viral aspartic protease n=1 Tax=Phytophthora megakarya TaxID=4795 RepID=A0A225VDE5_9STRA|nr:Eukaryotic/viral aspartic protease [Phytophthora megakarya]